MMKKFLILFILILACKSSFAAEPLTPQQKQQAVATISKAVSELKYMQCIFVQTKYMSMLNDRLVSYGTMYYCQPGKLRWEYTRPYDYLFIFNGAKVYVGNKTRKNIIDTGTNKLFREIANIMMSTVTGKALTNAEEFSIDIDADQNMWRVTLVPKKKEMKRMFQRVVLYFLSKEALITKIELYEKNGDKTEIKMTDVKTNTKIDEVHFNIPL